MSCIRIADWVLAQISHKLWAKVGKAGGQRYWKQSSVKASAGGTNENSGLMSPNSTAKLSNPPSYTDQLQNAIS